MKLYYQIQISFNPSYETYSFITNLLEVKPLEKNFDNLPDKIPHTWTYEIVNNKKEYVDIIEILLNILENKYEELQILGIERKDITIWCFYEYDQQCNMEYSSKTLKRLGDNEIVLCITCWDSGLDYSF